MNPDDDEVYEQFSKAMVGMGEMLQAATVLHEMYQSFLDVGFTEDQAMELLKAAMATKGP
jgi:hypothetical protein